MERYRHHVSGFFAGREVAQRTLVALKAAGIPSAQLQLFEAGDVAPNDAPPPDSNEVLKNMVLDGAMGTAIGTGIGAIAEIALVAANVSLFVASPLIGPLAMLGWGASVGGLLGAAVGAVEKNEAKSGRLADLVRDAVSAGQAVLVVETRTPSETEIASNVIRDAVGAVHDVKAG